jgi:hypothetical protein
MKPNLSNIKAVLCLALLIITGFLQSQENEYWMLKPGFSGRHLIRIDSTKVALIANEFVFIPEAGVISARQLNIHYFDNRGQYLSSTHINFSEIDNAIANESIISVYPFSSFSIGSLHHSIFRLSDGRFLVGGHGLYKHHNELSKITNTNLKNNIIFKTENLSDEIDKNNEDNYPIINPIIFTISEDFDKLIKIDTLEGVPDFGLVTLIHEITPDTIILGYHKTNESRHELLETDSLFNVRWKTEFGQIDASVADIYDFAITSDGDYLISLLYTNFWVPHFLGYRYNILYKFSKTGELLWQKNIRKNNNTISFTTNIISLEDDKFLLVYDNCCVKPPNFYDLNQIILTEETGIYLRVINNDGVTLSEKSLVDFLSAYVTTYTGYQPYGTTVENPNEAYPWFYPLQTIKNPDNTFLVTGVHYPTGRGLNWARGFLLKIDQDLNPVWIRIFDIDNKNYRYGANRVALNSIVTVEDYQDNSLLSASNAKRIFLGGTFLSVDFGNAHSPYYNPPNYSNPSQYRMSLFIPLDEHGCHEPGCHLVIDEDDNSITVIEAITKTTFYPNPAKDILHIKIDIPQLEEKTKVIFIQDISGTGMIYDRFSKNEHTLSIKNLPSGIYTAFIMCEGYILKTEKIVVVK